MAGVGLSGDASWMIDSATVNLQLAMCLGSTAPDHNNAAVFKNLSAQEPASASLPVRRRFGSLGPPFGPLDAGLSLLISVGGPPLPTEGLYLEG